MLLAAATPGEPPHYADITYPYELNFHPDEGSVEVWVKPLIDVRRPTKSFYHFFVFNTSLGKGGQRGGFTIMWQPRCGLVAYGVQCDERGKHHLQNTPTPWPKQMHWEKDTWHHVAFTWKNREMALYADGELVRRCLSSDPMPAGKTGVLMLGRGLSPVVFDDFCVSSIARTQEQIRGRSVKPLVPDVYTLLLDPLDSLKPISARRFASNPEAVKLVPGRHGMAIQVWQPAGK